MTIVWRSDPTDVESESQMSTPDPPKAPRYAASFERLVLAVLDRYVAKYGEASFRQLQNHDVAVGIRRVLDAVITRMINPRNPRGCLLTNATLAFGTGSPRIDVHVAGKIAAMQDQLEAAIVRVRDDGQIAADADPRQLVRFYAAVVQSLGVMHRAFASEAALRDIAAVAMRGWPGQSASARGAAHGSARRNR